MSETAPKTELMRSLGRLVRGLSALFWGLPIALVVCVQTANTNWLSSFEPYGLLAPPLVTSLLFYALWLMSDFQKQERVWINALDRSKLAALATIGLSPFLHWYQRMPEQPFFFSAVSAMALSALLFLFNLNQLLNRLAAMLPDETLRVETKLFTSFNSVMLILIPAFLAGLLVLGRATALPESVRLLLQIIEPASQWLLFFLVLLPTSITMSLTWKIKEAILSSVFGPD